MIPNFFINLCKDLKRMLQYSKNSYHLKYLFCKYFSVQTQVKNFYTVTLNKLNLYDLKTNLTKYFFKKIKKCSLKTNQKKYVISI